MLIFPEFHPDSDCTSGFPLALYASHQIEAAEEKRDLLRGVSGASEPCTALRSMFSPKSLRIVPAAAFFGSVAPISSRQRVIALSPSRHITTTGPEVMYLQRSP